MRVSTLALSFLMFPSLALAQDRGVALNMGRGLDSGMSVGWTFKENWTLRPTLGAAYSEQTGFEAVVGATVLRSISLGERVYAYIGAGVYYGSANNGAVGGNARTNQIDNSFYQGSGSLAYVTTPAGLRARIYGNIEAFAEAAYQHTLSGQFGLNQTGQFSGDGNERFGATFGISIRLQ